MKDSLNIAIAGATGYIGLELIKILSANNIKRYSNRELSFRKLKAFSRFFMTVFFTLNSSRVSCGKFFFF